MICSFQVSLRSKRRPRYLTAVPGGMTVWLILNGGALSFTEGKCYVCGFVFVDLHSPFLEPVFNAMQMVLEIEGGRCRIGVVVINEC